jgi:hypothetical protein
MIRSTSFAALLQVTALCAAALPTASGAQQTATNVDVALRGDFSGMWFNPSRIGQGFTIEVLDGGRAVVGWYTFDDTGAPFWLAGEGDVIGTVLRVNLRSATGGRFPSSTVAEAVTSTPWGTLDLRFTGCDAGEAEWTPTASGFQAGSMRIQRLTQIAGARCNAAEEFTESRRLDLERGDAGIVAFFADYPVGDETRFELDARHVSLPSPLHGHQGLRLSGVNHSDDLAMLVKAPVGGLVANALYDIEISADFASNVASGCFGIGGSPGGDVRLLLGAMTSEPSTRVDPSLGLVRPSFELPDGETGISADAVHVGDLGNRFVCENGQPTDWQLKGVSTRGRHIRERTDSTGTVWVVAGSDSGFEGRSTWFLTSLTVRMRRVEEEAMQPQIGTKQSSVLAFWASSASQE